MPHNNYFITGTIVVDSISINIDPDQAETETAVTAVTQSTPAVNSSSQEAGRGDGTAGRWKVTERQ